MSLLAAAFLGLLHAKPDYQVGLASWYGPGFYGRRTASGEVLKKKGFTAAHRTLKFGTLLQVRNLSNGKFVMVEVTDRGPYIKGRIIDLSRDAAEALDIQGTAEVSIQ